MYTIFYLINSKFNLIIWKVNFPFVAEGKAEMCQSKKSNWTNQMVHKNQLGLQFKNPPQIVLLCRWANSAIWLSYLGKINSASVG